MRDVFIVARDESALYAYLKEHFAGRPDVEVVLDRRLGERRRRSEPSPAERRTGGRRVRSVEGDLSALGFAVVVAR